MASGLGSLSPCSTSHLEAFNRYRDLCIPFYARPGEMGRPQRLASIVCLGTMALVYRFELHYVKSQLASLLLENRSVRRMDTAREIELLFLSEEAAINGVESTPARTSRQSNLNTHLSPISDDSHSIKDSNNSTYFIVGVGWEARGAHELNEAACHLGYPSIHKEIQCGIVPFDYQRNDFSVAQLHRMTEARNAHLRIFALMKITERCVKSRTKTSCGSAVLWQVEIMRALDELVKSRAVQALHGAPYASLLPQLIPLIRKYYGHDRLLLVFNTAQEDPATNTAVENYSASRSRKNSLLCRPEYAGVFNPTTLSGGVLDWMACIDEAIAAAGIFVEKVDLKQVFHTAYDRINGAGRQRYLHDIQTWRNSVRNLSDVKISDLSENNNHNMAHQTQTLVAKLASSEHPAFRTERMGKTTSLFMSEAKWSEYVRKKESQWAIMSDTNRNERKGNPLEDKSGIAMTFDSLVLR